MYVCAAAALRYDLIFAQRKQMHTNFRVCFSTVLLLLLFFSPLPSRPDYYYFGTKNTTVPAQQQHMFEREHARERERDKAINYSHKMLRMQLDTICCEIFTF